MLLSSPHFSQSVCWETFTYPSLSVRLGSGRARRIILFLIIIINIIIITVIIIIIIIIIIWSLALVNVHYQGESMMAAHSSERSLHRM